MSIDRVGHGGNLLSLPPCPQKRATLIHPPLVQFFKRKTAALILILKTAVWPNTLLPEQRFCNRCCECQQSQSIRHHKERADNCDFTHCYRLCVLASGSLITDVFNCRILISVSCLHFGQNSGKFNNTVSS